MKKQVNVTVFDKEEGDGEWPPEDASGFIAWFVGKIETIPEEHRAAAKIEIDSASGYEGDHYGHIEISYSRFETDEEEERREGEEKRYMENQKNRELQQLAALKAKYGESA